MSQQDGRNAASPAAKDGIRSRKVARRSFLARAAGFGVLTGASAGLVGCEELVRSDRCDSDTTDLDPFDRIGRGGDRCDSD